MLFLLLSLACQSGAQPEPEVRGGQARDKAADNEFVVDVVARVVAPGAPAAWSASAKAGTPAKSPLLPGECVDALAAEPAVLPPMVRAIGLDGAVHGTLLEGPGGWRTEGGLRAVDPSWSVGDLVWSSGDALGKRRIARAVRFGPSPEVREVSNRPEGIRLRWNPLSVEDGELIVSTAGGELRCGVGSAGVSLPRWVVPSTPEVRLRSVHQHVEQATAGLRVRVRAVIERIIPFDVAPAEIAPSAVPPAPLGPTLGPTRGGRQRPTRA